MSPSQTSTIVTALLSAALVICPILIRLLFPNLEAKAQAEVKHVEAKLGEDRVIKIRWVCRWAVQRVDQMRKAGLLPNDAEAQAMAVKFANETLAEIGIVTDVGPLVTVIESTLHDLNAEQAERDAKAQLPAVAPKA
jgi:hypothetical protein